MKKRFIPIIPITVALLLISGLVYALEKKKQPLPADLLPDTLHEEEALQAELMAATEEDQKKLSDKNTVGSGKIEIPKPDAIKAQVQTKR